MADPKNPEKEGAYKGPEGTLITKLGGLAERPETLQEIGRRLVKQAIQNAVAERMGQKLATPMVVRRVAKGELVPSDLLGQPDLVVGTEGRANSDWEKTWINLAIWDRNWSENEGTAFLPKLGLTDPKARFRLETMLTPEELAIVERLKIAE